MMATWFQGTADEFIAVNKEGYARGVRILHFLGGSSIDIEGTRAIAQTKMTISQRAVVDEVLCDVLCTGRFYDFPVDPAVVPKLDRDALARFPEGYRHLAYLQSRIGYPIKMDMPGLDGPEVRSLYAAGAEWLTGGRLKWG
jgi:hypothetical protein